MKNIEYLKSFFKKHKLSGKITVKYDGSYTSDDDYMSSIVFENGDTINISDIIFDIESGLDDDVVKQWMEYNRSNHISLMDWICTDNHYIPTNVNKSSMEEYKEEMLSIMEEVKNNMNTIFEFEPEEGEKNEEVS